MGDAGTGPRSGRADARYAGAFWRRWRPIVLTAALCYLSARIGSLLVLPGTNIGLFWPAAGLAVGLALLHGYRVIGGLVVASIAALLPPLLHEHPVGVALAMCAGDVLADTVETVLAVWMVRRFVGEHGELARVSDLVKTLLLAGGLSQAAGATIGVTTIWLGGGPAADALHEVWASWWLSNVASVSLLTPAVLVLRRDASRGDVPASAVPYVVVLGSAVIAGSIAFFVIDPSLRAYFEYGTILVVIWAAFRVGSRGAVAASLLLSVMAVTSMVLGTGPFHSAMGVQKTLLISVYIVTMSVTGLIVAAVLRERERGARRLEQSEARMRALLQASPLPIAWTTTSGVVEFWSRRAEEVFGWSHAEIPTLDAWIARACPDEAVRRVARERWRALLAGTESVLTGLHRARLPLICKDGTSRTVDVLAAVEGSRVLIIFDDQTEHLAAEARQDLLRAQLHQAQKLESIGRLAGGVAHDLNNLLTPILGFTDLLLAGAPEGSEAATDLAEIKRAAERGRDITRQLLAFSRKQMLDRHVIDLGAELRRFERLLRRALREDIRLGLTVPATPACVFADVAQMEQVVINLAVNAQEAMPDGGQLRIELEQLVLEPSRPPPAPELQPGRYIVLEVSDTGVGMTPEVLEHVFEPFFTTKKPGGTGLGLAIVHGIVQQHGGQVAVESRSGQGSTFRVYLPHADALPAVVPARAATVARGTETVLVAEDEDAVRAVAVRALERLGYRVLAAPDGHTCLELAGSEPGKIDVLLTDVVMPDMNGRQLHERLAARRPDLRVLFMSGYAGDVVTERGVQEAHAAFLQKPFTADALGEAVQRVIAGGRLA